MQHVVAVEHDIGRWPISGVHSRIRRALHAERDDRAVVLLAGSSASTCDGIDFPAANGGSCTIVMNPVAELNVTKDFTNDPEPGPTVDISFSCPDSDHVQATGSTTLGDGGVVSYYIYYVGTSVTCPAPTEITTNAPGYVENGPNGDADCADLPDNVTTFTGAGVVSTGQVSCTFTNSPEDNIAPTVTINQGGSQVRPHEHQPHRLRRSVQRARNGVRCLGT